MKNPTLKIRPMLFSAAFIMVFISAPQKVHCVSATENTEDERLISQWLSENSQGKMPDVTAKLHDIRALRTFYARTKGRPVWTSESRSSAKALWLMGAVRDAENDGLMPEDYHLSLLDSLHKAFRANDSEESAALFDLFLTDAFLLLATHLYYGKTNPDLLRADWFVLKKPEDINMPDYLHALLGRDDYLDGLNFFRPSLPGYNDLRGKLRHYRLRLTAHPWDPLLPADLPIRPGDENEAFPEIRKRLRLLGDCPDCTSETREYSPADEAAVKSFQRRHGLHPDGVIGAGTMEAINIRPAERIRSAAANLERMRWLPDNFGREHIVVNIANFQTDYIADGDTLVSTRSVVGRPYRKTPVFSGSMNHLVFSPTWTVPPGILRNDVLPAVRRDRNYLNEKNMVVLDRNGNTVSPSQVDWNASPFPYIIRQNPGRQNALGTVKFMFPNPYSVYIHDTPSRELFQREDRAFSSGCIRIADPFDLSKALLRNDTRWDDDRIRAAMNSGREQRVNLSPAVPVYLVYFTAWAVNGEIHFRKDVYSRDGAVIAAVTEAYTGMR